MIFKCEAEGDVLYIEAADSAEAVAKLKSIMGEIPETLLKWTKDVYLPEGEELL